MQKNAYGKMEVGGRLDVAVSDMCIVGDSLYYYGSEWNEAAQRNTVNYGIINVRTKTTCRAENCYTLGKTAPSTGKSGREIYPDTGAL